MDVRNANLVPSHATSAEHARSLVALDGAAIVPGIGSVDEAIAFGERMLGERTVRIRPQFEATKVSRSGPTSSTPSEPGTGQLSGGRQGLRWG